MYPGALWGTEATNNSTCASLGPYTDYISTGAQTINQNTWYCLAGTYDGDSVRIYLDGVLKQTKELANPINECGNSLMRIGRLFSAENQYFNGDIDELRIYNRPINAQEIENLCSFYQFPQNTTDHLLDNQIDVYPNPTQDILQFSSAAYLMDAGIIKIKDLSGKILKQKKFNQINETSINLNQFSSGVYLLTIETDKYSVHKKIIVQ